MNRGQQLAKQSIKDGASKDDHTWWTVGGQREIISLDEPEKHAQSIRPADWPSNVQFLLQVLKKNI